MPCRYLGAVKSFHLKLRTKYLFFLLFFFFIIYAESPHKLSVSHRIMLVSYCICSVRLIELVADIDQ